MVFWLRFGLSLMRRLLLSANRLRSPMASAGVGARQVAGCRQGRPSKLRVNRRYVAETSIELFDEHFRIFGYEAWRKTHVQAAAHRTCSCGYLAGRVAGRAR